MVAVGVQEMYRNRVHCIAAAPGLREENDQSSETENLNQMGAH